MNLSQVLIHPYFYKFILLQKVHQKGFPFQHLFVQLAHLLAEPSQLHRCKPSRSCWVLDLKKGIMKDRRQVDKPVAWHTDLQVQDRCQVQRLMESRMGHKQVSCC